MRLSPLVPYGPASLASRLPGFRPASMARSALLGVTLSLLGCPPADDKPTTDGDADTDTDADTDADTDTDVNAAPSAPEIAITPVAPADEQDMTVTIVTPSVDTDGDAVTYRYAWAVNGADRTDLTGETVSATETTLGEAWSVTVTPNDGIEDGTAATASVVIGNAPPVPPTLHIAPTAPESGADLTLVFDTPASDPDGDTLTQTITWYVDGSENLGFADLTEIAGSYVDGGETYRAVVTVTDGVNTPVTAEATTTIGNAPPTLSTPRINPTSPKDDNDLTVVARGTDPDGGALAYSYAWYRDGLEATDVGDSDTVPAELTTVGEEWTVTVTVSDGTDEVSDSAAAVTILDWEGFVYTQTFTAYIPNDGSGTYPTSTGDYSFSLLSQGGSLGANECALYWAVDSVEDARICPRCDYAFADTLTLDTTTSSATGAICTMWSGDGEGEWTFDRRADSFEAYHYLDGYSSGYSYVGYYVPMYATGTGGYSYSYGGAEYANYYSITTTEDSGGNVTLEAYQYVMRRY